MGACFSKAFIKCHFFGVGKLKAKVQLEWWQSTVILYLPDVVLVPGS